MNKIIHYSDYTLEPSDIIACDQSLVIPVKFFPETGIIDVYLSNNDRLYTFNDERITCEKCKNYLIIESIIV
jgi:hypothetical protein